MGKVEINSILPTKFSREVGENEKLCPVCGGLGLKVEGNFIITCHDCYKGIVKACKYCGKTELYSHNCDEERQVRRNEQHARDVIKWDKSRKITLEEACKTLTMVYVDNWDKYINVDGIDDKIDDHQSEDEDFEISDLRIYGTTEVKMSFDAGSIIESACEDLHEDAGDDISGDEIKNMQDFLDDWVEKYGSNTTSYEVDFSIGVIMEAAYES